MTTDLTIRRYDPERDAAWVRSLIPEIWTGAQDAEIEREYGPQGGRPWHEWLADAIVGYLAAEGTRSFVAEVGGERVGFCSYVVDEVRSRGTVGYNGVAKDRQGQRLGVAMMDHVMAAMRAEGLAYAGVLVADNEEHAPARRNYESHGFRRVSGYEYLFQKL